MSAKKGVTYFLIAFVAFVFLQSLFFKFTGSEETDIIFSTIADWMKTVGLGFIAPAFAAYGGYVIGGTELVATGLMINPKTRSIGAFLGLAVISGAIFFHLFTPLGVNRVVDSQGNTDGGVLFYMACGVWVSCLLIFILNRKNN
ncbi:DoxX family protein [Arenicella sp. 4NH20-0111]|uniref:hypothetical protein n=1 Tax=Arenicella sp. 4NH20-0111 TaxID=3127648 RepID=UPI0031029D57